MTQTAAKAEPVQPEPEPFAPVVVDAPPQEAEDEEEYDWGTEAKVVSLFLIVLCVVMVALTCAKYTSPRATDGMPLELR